MRLRVFSSSRVNFTANVLWTRDVDGVAADDRPALAGQVDLQTDVSAARRAIAYFDQTAVACEVEDSHRNVGCAETITIQGTGNLSGAWRRVGFARIGHVLLQHGVGRAQRARLSPVE